ncbi:hypothetical protein PoB_000019100 [Plakobranchus ocellatus]|uniref:Uncharacterized protein n=1 Tax=Plakobranchus ocellatus TaxID=259542 RepID=A0AAV3WS13_9GAST|nr:hypothetical protein PoB_000019100 [Plakobranchus ocellatus]
MFCINQKPKKKKQMCRLETKKKARSPVNRKLANEEAQKLSFESEGTSPSLNIEVCKCNYKYSPAKKTIDDQRNHLWKKGSKLDSGEKKKDSLKYNKGSWPKRNTGTARSNNKCGLNSTQDWSVTETFWDPNLSSIEIARDNNVIPMSFLRKGSPLLPLVLSNVGNDTSLGISRHAYHDKEDLEKLPWVTISSGPCDQSSTQGGSQYTYISTYTYGSTTTTSGTKKGCKSPTVFMQKKPAYLNSSVQKGKSDISEVEFPDFISPIYLKEGI